MASGSPAEDGDLQPTAVQGSDDHRPAAGGSMEDSAAGAVEDTGDVASTTGDEVPDTDDYVGRVAGQDVGYAGETGAERRATQ